MVTEQVGLVTIRVGAAGKERISIVVGAAFAIQPFASVTCMS